MKVVVTGTRNGRPDVAHWLRRFALKFGWPDEWIIGDAKGVDAQAYAWLIVAGVPVDQITRVEVNPELPSPQRFHDRNQRMVDIAGPGDACLAFPDFESKGTWDCFARAQRKGLDCVALPPLP